MTSSEFWQGQQFSHLVTYSFNRGPKLVALRQAAKALFQTTRASLLTAPASQLPELRAQLRLLERTHGLDLLTLTEGLNAYHITAEPVAAIGAKSAAAQALADWLQLPVVNQLHSMCGPLYRDALAFYGERKQLVGVLNICFSCNQMVNHAGQEVQADTAGYQALRAFLTELGHQISENEPY